MTDWFYRNGEWVILAWCLLVVALMVAKTIAHQFDYRAFMADRAASFRGTKTMRSDLIEAFT